MSNIYEKLHTLQQEFKAPKKEWNDHGKFKYRTIEKMLEQFKPLAVKHKVVAIFSDELNECAETPHIVATVTLVNLEDTKEQITVRASAQEAAVQKGMQAAQISGSTSSYARKYALSALLMVDDTDELDKKDGDDQFDWEAEIKTAPNVQKLMKIFNKMSPEDKSSYTALLSERKRELTEAEV